jgi:hypothetical protein
MPRSVLRLTLALTLLAVPFGGPASAAGGPATAFDHGALWAFLAQFLPSGSLGKAGCRFDPFGLCIEKQPPVDKAGCRADPYGRCLPTP